MGENGHVFQGMQITGTFYQDFKLKNYPYGSLEAAISLRLSQSLYNSQDAVTILPVPVAAKYLENNNGDSAGNGWYLSNVRLVGNRPDFVRDLRDFDLSDPITNASMMDWRGANMTEGRLRDGQFRLSSFLSLLDAFSPTLDFRFDLHVGSVDAFITTLPLALLALLNLSVFLTPLFDPRNRISYSISLFFTTTATLLTQNYGGTNELNAVQRLAVVIFAMLVFTVFSTIVWNGVFNYKEGKAEVCVVVSVVVAVGRGGGGGLPAMTWAALTDAHSHALCYSVLLRYPLGDKRLELGDGEVEKDGDDHSGSVSQRPVANDESP